MLFCGNVMHSLPIIRFVSAGPGSCLSLPIMIAFSPVRIYRQLTAAIPELLSMRREDTAMETYRDCGVGRVSVFLEDPVILRIRILRDEE